MEQNEVRRRRRPRHVIQNEPTEAPSTDRLSVAVEMDMHYDISGFAPIVRTLHNSKGYLYGIPIEAFGFEYKKGTRFKLTCERIPAPKEMNIKNPIRDGKNTSCFAEPDTE